MPGTVRRWNYPSPLCIGMDTYLFSVCSEYQSEETSSCVMPIVPSLNSVSFKAFLFLFVSMKYGKIAIKFFFYI